MKKILIIVSIIIAYSMHAVGMDIEKPTQPLDMKKLRSGNIQILEYTSKEGKKIRMGIVLIDAQPKAIWNLLEDWKSIGEVLPYVEYCKKINGDYIGNDPREKKVIIEEKLNNPHFDVQYTLEMVSDDLSLSRKWHMLSSDEVDTYNKRGIKLRYSSGLIKNTEGMEYLEGIDNGTKTLYFYAPLVETSIPLPEFINRSIFKNIIDDHLNAIKASSGMIKGAHKKQSKSAPLSKTGHQLLQTDR